MKHFCTLLATLSLVLCARPACAATINGQTYISAADWARANGLHTVSQTSDKIVLADKSSRLVLTTDSAEAEINGVNVRLSFPVANDHGTALIAQFDIDSAVKPLLFPSGYVDHSKITTICLDPGHGGKDTGNRVYKGYWHNEKTYTLLLADELRDQLKRAGFKVVLTRSKDVYVDLPDRPAIANKAGADLFISLHFNATGSSKDTVNGIETYCITPVGAASSNAQGVGSDHAPVTANRWERRSLLFAYQMQKSLVSNLHAEDRDVRRARFAVLRDAQMPAILIEGGYMTHPTEGKDI
ncbi:MAG TPA: N-acetylmuramoyl-L-alanine amidase, partial [Verrucomicrobiae bacterium]|nr:N-acetylmuramoyl-L-alanine amidase [Verrucomicrobiae bacterium]